MKIEDFHGNGQQRGEIVAEFIEKEIKIDKYYQLGAAAPYKDMVGPGRP
jgi:hypothetical protein